ncbi:MAG: hypothetical protein A2854_01225 [Parcubacteria group bacterium RIFCSPHIGHO2_01_FULL_56_18]|nr:MAG: hypothetical protein A2854_01225 [Parcubacteria group bacterium RIFCSPHIGHO2_01_FULL_56_18]
MTKSRIENLSDGTFAIILTLLVIELLVPDKIATNTEAELIRTLSEFGPLLIGYAISFAVIIMFWITHGVFFGTLVKTVNRPLALINALFLGFLALIPFSAHMLGRYMDFPIAAQVYGINVLILGLLVVALFEYALYAKEVKTNHNDARTVALVRARIYLTPAITFFGLLMTTISIPAALFFFAFPIVFNSTPGLMTKLEEYSGVHLGDK